MHRGGASRRDPTHFPGHPKRGAGDARLTHRILVSVGFGYEGQVAFFRLAAFVVPFIVFLLTRRVCEELQVTETHPLRSFAGSAVRRSEAGGFEEIMPIEPGDEHWSGARSDQGVSD